MAYDNGTSVRQSLDTYFSFYNSKRKHQSIDRQPPDQVYFTQPSLPQAA